MRRLLGAIILAATITGLVGCSSVALPLPCDLTIVALPADSTLQPGDPLPAGAQVLARPDDFDRSAVAIVNDDAGNPAVSLELRGDAIARVAAHTAGHVGEFMAISINGDVVAVPVIQSPLLDGKIQISSGSEDGDDLAAKFVGCVR